MIAMKMPLLNAEIAARIEQCETEYFALRLEMLQALPGNPYEIEVRQYGGAKAFQARNTENHWFFNRVMNISHAELDELDEMIAWYRENNISCRFDIVPSLSSPGLLRGLASAGLYQSDFVAALYGMPSDEMRIPPNVTVRTVQSHEGELLARLYLHGYGVPEDRHRFLVDSIRDLPGHPRVRCYFAYVDSSLAGMAVLFLSGGIGYLASAATLPEYRGYGCQRALIYTRLAAAASEDCSLVVAHSDVLSTGQRNLEKLGLRVAYTKVIWTEFER